MSFKVHTPPNLTDDQMLERVRQYQAEKEKGQLRNFDNAEQFSEFLEVNQQRVTWNFDLTSVAQSDFVGLE